jgi:hypothetical protein
MLVSPVKGEHNACTGVSTMAPFGFASHLSLASSDLALLQSVLDAWACEKGVAMGSDEASCTEQLLTEWFQLGIRSPSQFRALLEPQ